MIEWGGPDTPLGDEAAVKPDTIPYRAKLVYENDSVFKTTCHNMLSNPK